MSFYRIRLQGVSCGKDENMEIAKVNVSGARCTPESVGTITRGMVGATVSIEYTDPLWDDLTKTVVFKGVCTKDVLNAGSVVTVPAEVVATAGKPLFVGVYGVDADNNLVIPTLWAELGTIEGGASPSGDSTTESAPPVWAQIQAVANNAEAIAKSVREDADAGVFNGATGPVGPTGAAAEKLSNTVEYQSSTSGDAIPSGTWSTSIPSVLQGEYLWTRTTMTFNTGTPVVSYSVTRFGIDGAGSVSSVCNVSPDSDGNVALNAEAVGALPTAGGAMAGSINMQGQTITGLNDPTADTDAARKAYVDSFANSRRVQNLLGNSDFRNPVNQRGYESGAGVSDYDYFLDRWKHGIAEKTNYTLSSAGLGIPSGTYIVQVNETIRSGTYTFAVKQSDGSITILNCVVSFAADGSWKRCGTISADGMALHVDTENGHVVYIIQSYKDVVVEWAAFYEGSYTADTLPPYVPKGYGAELLECQRYYVPNTSTAVFVPANGYLTVYFPVDMRLESPTITAESSNDNDCTVSLVSRRGFVLVNNNAAISQIYWEASADL